MNTVDVTDSGFEITDIDGEMAGVNQCECGARFSHWDYSISIDKSDPFICPKCGRKYYFSYSTRFYRIEE